MRRRSFAPFALLPLLVVVAACGDDDDPSSPPEVREFEADLQVADPAIISEAQGTATFSLVDGQVEFEIQVQDIADVTAAHIHLGGVGESGPVVVPLFGTENPVTIDAGVLVSDMFDAGNIVGDDPPTFDELIDMMEVGQVYVNVHTQEHPAGEIRGQVRLAP